MIEKGKIKYKIWRILLNNSEELGYDKETDEDIEGIAKKDFEDIAEDIAEALEDK